MKLLFLAPILDLTSQDWGSTVLLLAASEDTHYDGGPAPAADDSTHDEATRFPNGKNWRFKKFHFLF